MQELKYKLTHTQKPQPNKIKQDKKQKQKQMHVEKKEKKTHVLYTPHQLNTDKYNISSFSPFETGLQYTSFYNSVHKKEEESAESLQQLQFQP